MVFKPTNTMQKKAVAKVDNKITALVGALIVIILAVELAPQMFSGVADLSNATYNNSSGQEEKVAPDWMEPILYVIIGAGLVFIIWNTFK